MPGPDKKKPKTSLYVEFSQPKYSEEPNAYLNSNESDVGTKSNSKTATSFILETVNEFVYGAGSNGGTELATASKSGSVTVLGMIGKVDPKIGSKE